jgi:hypothetical protein
VETRHPRSAGDIGCDAVLSTQPEWRRIRLFRSRIPVQAYSTSEQA